jgi:hypothetical protein
MVENAEDQHMQVMADGVAPAEVDNGKSVPVGLSNTLGALN